MPFLILRIDIIISVGKNLTSSSSPIVVEI